MKAKTLLLALAGALLATMTVAAEDRPVVGFISYEANPVALKTTVGASGLKYLGDMARLMKAKAFTFLQRKSSDQWMGLTRTAGGAILHIHDAPAAFNFRALVNLKTGQLTVLKGVDYRGFSRQDDADYAAHLAVNYLTRLMKNQGLFSGSPAKPAMMHEDPAHNPAPSSHAAPKGKTEAHSAPAGDAHSMAKPAAKAEGAAHGTTAEADAHGSTAKVEAPWSRLMTGNRRFIAGKALHPNQSMARIAETAKGQKPFAIVVSCSDSRVPPEVLFDQGVGDLFVVRTAGEVVTQVELGSIEYAVEHLGAAFIVVMGHEKCGAVDATVKGGDVPPNIAAIAAVIKPAVERAKALGGNLLDNSIRENVKEQLAVLKTSSILREALDKGHLSLAGAYYSISSGAVSQVE